MDYAKLAEKYGGTTTKNYADIASKYGGSLKVEDAPQTSSVPFPASANDTGLQAGLKALGNTPSSALNLVKGTVSAVANPIQTLKGVGSVIMGGAQKLIPEEQGQEDSFNAFAKMLKERYGSLEALQKTATEDPFAFGTDLLGVAGGVAGLTGKTSQLNRAITATGELATSPVSNTLSKIPDLRPKLLSYTSDVPEKAFETLLQRRQPVAQAIKEGVGAEQALSTTQGAVRSLRKTLSNEWQEGVQSIANQFTNRRFGLGDNALNTLEKLSDEFGFTIPANPKSASAVEWIDTLKSMNELPRLLLSVSPKGAQIRKIKDTLKTSVVEQFGGKGGPVDQLYSNYATKKAVFDAANDIVGAYSTGKPIKQTTALNRLQNIFDENKPAYLQAILDLEQATGQDLLSRITASKFQNMLPSKFDKLSSAGGLGTPKGLTDKAVNLLLLPLTSPKMSSMIARLKVPDVVTGTLKDINQFKAPRALQNREIPMGLSIKNVSSDLVQEARKYKSAEELYKEGVLDPVLAERYKEYSPSGKWVEVEIDPKNTKYFGSASEQTIREYDSALRREGLGNNFKRASESDKPIVINKISPKGELSVFDGLHRLAIARSNGTKIKAVMPESQLTDIWKKANAR